MGAAVLVHGHPQTRKEKLAYLRGPSYTSPYDLASPRRGSYLSGHHRGSMVELLAGKAPPPSLFIATLLAVAPAVRHDLRVAPSLGHVTSKN